MITGIPILFRCDASPEIGFGHIGRCLALAEELHETHNCHIGFAMRSGMPGVEMMRQKNYRIFTSQENGQPFEYARWLKECAKSMGARALILDARDGLPGHAIDDLRKAGILTVTIDDPEDKRLSTDYAFYPPVPQVKRMNWATFTGQLYVGWEWVILRKEFSQNTKPKETQSGIRTQNSRFKILITMGGSDPKGMTIKAVKALEMLDDEFETIVVLGAGFQHRNQLINLLSNCNRQYSVLENVNNMAEIMSHSDLAITSFGVTAYELAATGLPAIYLCLSQDHAESATALEKEGMAVSLGVFTGVSPKKMALQIGSLLNHMSRLTKLADNAKKKIDGQGAQRISRLIMENLTTGYE